MALTMPWTDESPTGYRPLALQSPEAVPSITCGLKLSVNDDDGGLKLPSGLQLGESCTFSDDTEGESPSEKQNFSLSQSGAFTVEDFELRANTGLRALSPDAARGPAELGFGVMALPIGSFGDLEMVGELGSGASGTVYKARHVGTGTAVAVKAVTILQKEKREQVLSELRLMRR